MSEEENTKKQDELNAIYIKRLEQTVANQMITIIKLETNLEILSKSNE